MQQTRHPNLVAPAAMAPASLWSKTPEKNRGEDEDDEESIPFFHSPLRVNSGFLTISLR